MVKIVEMLNTMTTQNV